MFILYDDYNGNYLISIKPEKYKFLDGPVDDIVPMDAKTFSTKRKASIIAATLKYNRQGGECKLVPRAVRKVYWVIR